MPLPPWLRKPKPPGRHTGGRYTHGNQGRASDLPDSPWFRSRMERNYARFLTWQGIPWTYEPKTFVFEAVRGGKNRQYKPDFYLTREQVYHEVKGWQDRDTQIKLKYMKKYFPDVKVLLIPKTFFEELERQKLCQAIPAYECKHFPERLQASVTAYEAIPGQTVITQDGKRRKIVGPPPKKGPA